MMHAWRNARTAAPSQRALASASSRSAVTLLHWRPLLSAAPRSWLLHSSRGFASKNPFGRGGVARAENPWGSSSRRATNATHAQQQHPPPQPPPRNERGANRSSPGTRNSESGARGAWATRSRDGSGSAGSGGKKHYQPRTLGAAAAAANPRPKTEARSATNANGPAWAPVAAKFAEATAWTPAPQKAWSRGGGTKQSETSAQPSSSAGAQSWARSAARRERSHGVSLPDLSAPAPTQPPAGSHKRGSRPTAEGRSSYRHGGERDARSKMRERERERYPSSSAASTLSSDPSSSSTDASRPSRSSPRSFEQTADLEEDTQEHVESTKSAAEFWTHFPSVSNAVKKGATTGSSSAAQVPQRLVPLPPEPEQYKPVFLNHPASSSNAAPPAAATNAASRSRSAPAPAKAKVRGSELNELMGSSIASVSLNRSTLRLGVLLPEPPPADIGFVDPEAPPPSEAERALEAFHAGVRLRIEGMSQELASATGAELVTHPLHVDMCAEFVPMDRQDVTGGTATIAAAPAPASGSSASSTLPPDPLLVLQLFESSIRHAPSSHRGHLRIRADASTGQASGVRGTALKGQGFFPSFFDYFRHAAARVHRDASEAKLMARNAMIRAVGWKPAQDNIAAAEEAEEEEEGEEDDEATTDAEAEQAAQSESPKESASAHAASASSTPASATPSKTFAGTSASSKPKSRRLRLRNVSTQLPQPLAGLTVMDATAGFGVDAFALAMSGATVHAYESFPLFQTLLRQAFTLIRRSPSSSSSAVAATGPAQALDGRLQFVLDRVTLHEADALQAMRASADAGADVPAMPKPDVVYIDLYPPSTSLSPASLPFRVAIRSRYLRLLCDRPTPAEVDSMLSAALATARSHVVMKFPSKGEHYRPGDAVPGVAPTQQAAEPSWEVARIYKHKHMQSEFVVYTRKSA